MATFDSTIGQLKKGTMKYGDGNTKFHMRLNPTKVARIVEFSEPDGIKETMIDLRVVDNGAKEMTSVGTSLNLTRTKMLLSLIPTIDQKVERLNNGLHVDYKAGLGGNQYITVNSDMSLVNVRTYWLPPGSSTPHPTKKGIALKPDEYRRLKKFLLKLETHVPEIKHTDVCIHDSQNEKGTNDRLKRNSWAGTPTMPGAGDNQSKGSNRQRFRPRERGRNNALPGFFIDKNAEETEMRPAPVKYWAHDQVFDKQSHRGSLHAKTATDNKNYDGSDDSGDNEKKRWTKNPLIVRKLRKNERNSRNFDVSNGTIVADNVLVAQPVSDSGVYAAKQSHMTNANTKGKFDKLEDRRRRRINASLTSDDEGIDVQMSISKLRQNALKALSKENVSDSPKGDGKQPFVSYSQTFDNASKRNSNINTYMSVVAEQNPGKESRKSQVSPGNVERYSSSSLPKDKKIGFVRCLLNGKLSSSNDGVTGARHSFNPAVMAQSVVTPRVYDLSQNPEKFQNRQGMLFSSVNSPTVNDRRNVFHDDNSAIQSNKSSPSLQMRIAMPNNQSQYAISEQNKPITPKKFPTSHPFVKTESQLVTSTPKVINSYPGTTKPVKSFPETQTPIKSSIEPVNFLPNQSPNRYNQSGIQQSLSSNTTPVTKRKLIKGNYTNETDSLDELLESNKDYLYTLQRAKRDAAQNQITQNITPQNITPQNTTPQNLRKQQITPQSTPQNVTPQNIRKQTIQQNITTPLNATQNITKRSVTTPFVTHLTKPNIQPKPLIFSNDNINHIQEPDNLDEGFTSVKSVIEKLQRHVDSNVKPAQSIGSPDLKGPTVRKTSIGLMSDNTEIRDRDSKHIVKVDSMDDLWIPRKVEVSEKGDSSKGVGDNRNLIKTQYGRSHSNSLFDGCPVKYSQTVNNAQSLPHNVRGEGLSRENSLGCSDTNLAHSDKSLANSDIASGRMVNTDRGMGHYGRDLANVEKGLVHSDKDLINNQFISERTSRARGSDGNINLEQYKINKEFGNSLENEKEVEEEVSARVKKWEGFMKDRNNDIMTKSEIAVPMKVSLVDDKRHQFTLPDQPKSVGWDFQKISEASENSAGTGNDSGGRRRERRPENVRRKSLIERKFYSGDLEQNKVAKLNVDVGGDNTKAIKHYTPEAIPRTVDQSVERIEVSRDTIVHKKNPPLKSKPHVHTQTFNGGAKDLYIPGSDISAISQNLSKSVYVFPSNPFNANKFESQTNNKIETNHFSEPGTLKTNTWSNPHAAATSRYEDQLSHSLSSIVPEIKETYVEDPIWKEIEKMTSYASSVAASTSQLNTTPKSLSSTPLRNTLTPQERDFIVPEKGQDVITPKTAVNLSAPKYDYHNRHVYQYNKPKRDFKQANEQYNSHINRHNNYGSLYNKPDVLDDVLQEITLEQKRRPFSPKIKSPITGTCSNSSVFSIASPEIITSPPPPAKPTRIHSQYDQPLPIITQEQLLTTSYDNVVNNNFIPTYTQPPPRQVHSDSKFINMAPHGQEYQLDLSLLKQKLLATGLVESTDESTDIDAPRKSPSLVAKETEQMNQAIEDLKELAREVEIKVSNIKKKIVCTEENNIDDILSTLKQYSTNNSQHGFTHSRKAQLNDALTELESVFKGLSGDTCGNDAWKSGNNASISKLSQFPHLTDDYYTKQYKPVPPVRFAKSAQLTNFNNRSNITNALSDVENDLMKTNIMKPSYKSKAYEMIEQLELSHYKDQEPRSPLQSLGSPTQSNPSNADPVTDDLAARRFKKIEKLKLYKPDVMSPTYMSLSPVFTPVFSPDNLRKIKTTQDETKSPDKTKDDFMYRKFKDSNRADAVTSPMVNSPTSTKAANHHELKSIQKGERKSDNSRDKYNFGDVSTVAKPPLASSDTKEMKTVETQTGNVPVGSARETMFDDTNKRSYARLEKRKIDRKNRRSLGHTVGKMMEHFTSSDDDQQSLSNSAPDLLQLDMYSDKSITVDTRNTVISSSCTATPKMKTRNKSRLNNCASRETLRKMSTSSDDSESVKTNKNRDVKHNMSTNNDESDKTPQNEQSYVVVRRNKYTPEEKLERTERSRSFPELLATFETKVNRGHRISLTSQQPENVTMAMIMENFTSEPNVCDHDDRCALTTKDEILKFFGIKKS